MARRSDPRFDDMHHAPIFKKVKKDNFKTKLDDRFKTVLTDDRFNTSSLGEGVDKHGKKKSGSSKKAARDLKAFYNIDDKTTSDNTRDGEDKVESRLDYLSKLSRGEISGDSGSDSDSGNSSDSDASSSDDSSSDESDSDESDSDNGYSSRKGSALSIPGDEVVTSYKRHPKQHSSSETLNTLPVEDEQSEDNDNEEDIESSNRLAIQNCDWENMSAEDIMAILQSFCSTISLEAGSVKSVTVYPSDYGLERMETENMHGPPKEIWNSSLSGHHSDEESEGESIGETSDTEDDEDEDEDEEAVVPVVEDAVVEARVVVVDTAGAAFLGRWATCVVSSCFSPCFCSFSSPELSLLLSSSPPATSTRSMFPPPSLPSFP
mmetsp:Transcript_20792/g.35007  ORF Transcript_20792/g.35007 Transcript_20792/m.35007 type:complete len:377 (+) Transcript_20792:95-1225(+)